jgi:ABC-type transport system involved in cytochrome c biogenesis permease subunit
MSIELGALWCAIAAYMVAGAVSVSGVVRERLAQRAVLALLVVGLAAHASSIAARWTRIGHGPFITMYEILSSNIFSLLAIFTLVSWRIRAVRPSAAVVLPLLAVMMVWLLTQDPRPGHLPATYGTAWLWIHVGFGKAFLGAVLIAVGVGGVVLLRRTTAGALWFARLPASAQLDELAYRFLALALVSDTLMLIAGAIWAQDAWGRYWAWDPLETWAFMTWLLLAFALHVRASLRPSPAVGAWLALGVFALAFLTFFGVPFLTQAPHQGVV